MTDKKNILYKIKEIFNTEKVEETTEMNFIDVKTEDGRILRVEDMAIEKPIMEITEDGEIALEDGEYKIIDGPVIKVEAGMIKEIEAMEEEPAMEDEVVAEQMSEEVAEEVAEEVIEETTEEVVEDTTEEVVEEDAELDELLGQLRGLVETVNELKEMKEGFASLKEENEKLKLEVEKFAKAPSAEATDVKINFKKETKEVKEKTLLQLMLENKNK